jgi:hypothetical protein
LDDWVKSLWQLIVTKRVSSSSFNWTGTWKFQTRTQMRIWKRESEWMSEWIRMNKWVGMSWIKKKLLSCQILWQPGGLYEMCDKHAQRRAWRNIWIFRGCIKRFDGSKISCFIFWLISAVTKRNNKSKQLNMNVKFRFFRKWPAVLPNSTSWVPISTARLTKSIKQTKIIHILLIN